MNLNTIFSRRLLVATVASVALVATAAGVAGGKWHKHDNEDVAEHIVDRIDHKLDLSNAQEQQLTDIITKQLAEREKLREQRHAEIQALWQQDNISADDIKAAMQAHHAQKDSNKAAQREAHMSMMAQTMAEVHAVLTPEQRQVAAKMMSQHDWMGAMRGKGKGKGERRHGYGDDHYDCKH